MQSTGEQKPSKSALALVAFGLGTVLTVSRDYYGHDPVWFVPLVLLLLGGGLAANYYRNRVSVNSQAAFVAIAMGGVVGMIYFLSLGAISNFLGYGQSIRSLPLSIGLFLLYLPGWVMGACLGLWAVKKRQIRLIT